MEMENRTIESGVQLFSRINAENSQILNGVNPKLFPKGGPFANQVIEVLFDSTMDVTDFFIDLIIRAVLPSTLGEEFKESQVILLQTDFQFNLFKIIKFIEKKLEQCKVEVGKRKNMIEEALKKIVILNCFTTELLEITFYNLERILNNCQKASLVILENCLSQYWAEKFNNSKLSFDEHSVKTVDLLVHKINELNIVVMYGRAYTSDNMKRSYHVGCIIYISRKEDGYNANVLNLENNEIFDVTFKVNIGLEFV